MAEKKAPTVQFKREYTRFVKARLQKRRALTRLKNGECAHCGEPNQARETLCRCCWRVPADLTVYDTKMERARLEFTVASGLPLTTYTD